MLPGTFAYVYLGSLGKVAADAADTGAAGGFDGIKLALYGEAAAVHASLISARPCWFSVRWSAGASWQAGLSMPLHSAEMPAFTTIDHRVTKPTAYCNGAVLPLPSAPEGRGADGVDAMA
jgi:hypothetical protein